MIERLESPRHSCPTCKRPYLETSNEQRTRYEDHVGLEKQAVKDIEEMNRSCVRIFEYMKAQPVYDWVSGDELRNVLNGGDGPRRVRQLNEEFAIPIDRRMHKPEDGRRQAYYRITPSWFTAESFEQGQLI